MAITNTRYTPNRRGPALGDGLGGTSERPQARVRDRVLRVVGHRTEDIRLTPGGADVSAGDGALYNLGAPDQLSVGRYLITSQDAASATAEPLGAIRYMVVEIREETAGVFAVAEVEHFDQFAANEDDTQDLTNVLLATRATDTNVIDFSGADADDMIMMAVIMTATQVTDLTAAGLTQGSQPIAGDFVIFNAVAAATDVYTITRLS